MKKNKDIGYEETEKTGLKRYVKIVDSIAMFDNFVSPELCKKLINIFKTVIRIILNAVNKIF